MRNTILHQGFPLLVCAVILMAISPSCKKADIQAISESSELKISTLKQFIATTTGIAITAIAYSPVDKEFIIDNDGIISLEEAEAHYKNDTGLDVPSGVNGIAQRKNIYTISPSNTSSISIYADNTVPTAWLVVLDQAIANWNSVNSSLYLFRTTSSRKAKTVVTTTYNTTSTIATANYPDNYGNPGKRVTINTYYNGMADAQKIFVLTHELGHACGFTHTNGSFGTLISGTPELDPASIMNSFVLNWAGFTNYDITAIRTVYPK